MEKEYKKIKGKKWLIFFISLFLIIIYFTAPFVWRQYKGYRIGKDYREFEEGMIRFLENDTYGGKTPRETYEMYIDALKKDDIELACKYFWWDRQLKQREKLQNMKDEGVFEKYLNSLPKWEDLKEEDYWDPDGKSFVYEEVLEEEVTMELPNGAGGFIEHTFFPGKYKQWLNLQINKNSNIWKIYSV